MIGSNTGRRSPGCSPGPRHPVYAALSATGVAGPDWQDDERPGMVWLGLALPVGWDDRIRARRLQLDGDRAQIRAQTIQAALAWL